MVAAKSNSGPQQSLNKKSYIHHKKNSHVTFASHLDYLMAGDHQFSELILNNLKA